MYVHEEPTNEKSLEISLQQAKETEHPFILDLTHLEVLSSRLIQNLIETHTIREDFYILLPQNSPLMTIFKRESLLSILNVFNRLKDLDKALVSKIPPLYSDYFLGKLFDVDKEYKDELDRVSQDETHTYYISSELRSEFLQRGFSLPQKIAIDKQEDQWWISEYVEKKNLRKKTKVLYVIRENGLMPLEICQKMLVYSLYGSLKGKELANTFLENLKNESAAIILLDLNNCYWWDEHFFQVFKKAKEFKKIYVIRADDSDIDFLFRMKGDIIYGSYESAYMQAELILTKRWVISPEPQNEYEDPQQVVTISGYLSNDEDDITFFRKQLIRAMKKTVKYFKKACLDIRELYRLESSARKAFLLTLVRWAEKNKIRKFNIIIIATLPRPDYIVYDVVSDLYANEFFIVSTVEEALEMHSSHPYPRFFIENSLNSSILTLKGNIIHSKEKSIFEGEVQNMIEHAMSLSDTITNALKSPKKVVFFDFRTIPCVYVPIIKSIIDIEYKNKDLVKILLVSEHLEELIKKMLSSYSNIFCYSKKEDALKNHVCDILIVSPRKEAVQAKTYFTNIFKDIYQIPEAKNSQLRAQFHFDFDRLASRLTSEEYSLIILYGYSDESIGQRVSKLLKKYENPVLELKKSKEGWLQLFSHQLEINCTQGMLKERIIDALWKHRYNYKENRVIFEGRERDRALEEIFLECLNESELKILGNFLQLEEDSQYEVIFTHKTLRNHRPIELKDASKEQFLEKIEFHPYKDWKRAFSYHYDKKILDLSQHTGDKEEIENITELIREYTGVKKRIWDYIPNKIKNYDDSRWISYVASKENFAGITFKSKIFEIQYILLFLNSDIGEIFNVNLYMAIEYLKRQLERDLRFRNFELPLLSLVHFIYTFLNDEAFKHNVSWLSTSIEIREDDGIEVILNTENISGRPAFAGEITRVVEEYKEKYKIEMEADVETDSKVVTIKFLLKSKMNTRLITFKK